LLKMFVMQQVQDDTVIQFLSTDTELHLCTPAGDEFRHRHVKNCQQKEIINKGQVWRLCAKCCQLSEHRMSHAAVVHFS